MDGQTRMVQAKYPFKATNNDELCFQKGDIVTITQQVEGGWWEGTLDGKTGWFPSNYVVEWVSTDEAHASHQNCSVPAVDASVKEQHHILVTKHLVESEGEYVNELKGFLQTYLKPLSTANIISSNEYSTLCGNLVEIITFQQKFLKALTDCTKLAVSQQKIGGMFLSNAPHVQSLYHAYAANHPSSANVLAQYREELAEFMESQGASAPGSKVLIGQLSSPFRRLEKYPALLKELERHIDDGHIDRGDTQRAIEVYKDIHSSTEEVRKDKEMEIEILSADINNWEGEELSTLGDVELSAHVKVHSDDEGSSDRIMLLFPACILMVSLSNTDMTYYYQGKLMLAGLKVKKLEDTETYSNALQLSGSMIDGLVVSFNSTGKQTCWYDYLILKCDDDSAQQLSAPKSVKSATMPAQVTSKAQIQNIKNTARTAQVIESYDKLNTSGKFVWSGTCLRPLPPTRPHLLARDDTRSPKIQRKASTLGRRKHVDDAKTLQEDAKILKVIEAYCISIRSRHTINSSSPIKDIPQLFIPQFELSCVRTLQCHEEEHIYECPAPILDSPSIVVADDEKILCEVTKDNQTHIEERSLVDTVYMIKDQVKELQEEYQKLKKELEEERKGRRKLESLVQKSIQTTRIPIPVTSANTNSSLNDAANVSS